MPETGFTPELLDPKNDYVFFRLFSEEPALLIDLINAVLVGEGPIVEISLLDGRLMLTSSTGRRTLWRTT